MNRQAAGKKSEIAKFAANEQPALVSRFVRPIVLDALRVP
jgi:hypothetical protein